MLNSLTTFRQNISQARDLTALFDFLSASVASPFPYDDLLRSQIVYSVSAFDKLIHDLVRIGMVAIFTEGRPSTPKYHNEPITLEMHVSLVGATMPPKEILFEREIVRKLAIVAYQEPTRVADGTQLYLGSEQQVGPHRCRDGRLQRRREKETEAHLRQEKRNCS
jgi:hypothetical protein